MTGKRVIERLKNENWERCEMSQLIKGDMFRMFEDNGATEIVKDLHGNFMWEALSDPFLDEIGIWGVTVDCSKYPGEESNV